MACVRSFWLQWGTVCSLLALLFAQDNLWDCSNKDDVLREMPADVDIPSACTLYCTVLTYRTVLRLKDKLTIRFEDSHAGEPDEYCWSTKIKCNLGQHLQSAFIVLPVDLSLVDEDSIRLQISSPTNAATLDQHTYYSLLPSACGLRFNVIEQLAAKKHLPTLCIKITAQEQCTLGRELKCPPFLVTTWKQWNQG